MMTTRQVFDGFFKEEKGAFESWNVIIFSCIFFTLQIEQWLERALPSILVGGMAVMLAILLPMSIYTYKLSQNTYKQISTKCKYKYNVQLLVVNYYLGFRNTRHTILCSCTCIIWICICNKRDTCCYSVTVSIW